jgi:hypothetical protein
MRLEAYRLLCSERRSIKRRGKMYLKYDDRSRDLKISLRYIKIEFIDRRLVVTK